jgi:protein TonB
MDAVGAILAEKEKDNFPWAAGATLALLLHCGIAGAFLVSSLAKPVRLAPPRAVAVRILSAGALRVSAPSAPAPAAEPAKPRIEKPPEEAPPPPSEKAVLLPAREEKKKKPTPAPAAPVTAPRAPELSLPSSGEQAGAPAGATSQAAGGGGSAGVGGAQFDQPDFKYSYYVDRMVLAIATNWFKPTQNVPVNPVVKFRIERDGTVTDPQIERSSGLPFVDRAALRAVIASSPLPPLPADYTGGHLGVHLVFE